MTPEPLKILGDELAIALLAALLLLLLLPPLAVAASRPKQKEYTRTVMVVRCPACGYTELKQYTKYAYVGMNNGKCPRCGKTTRVHAIYVERLPAKTGKEEGKGKQLQPKTPLNRRSTKPAQGLADKGKTCKST